MNCPLPSIFKAVDTAGREAEINEYLLRYQYGEQLVKKLAEVMEK